MGCLFIHSFFPVGRGVAVRAQSHQVARGALGGHLSCHRPLCMVGDASETLRRGEAAAHVLPVGEAASRRL